MFTVRMIRQARGSVKFHAEGGFPERFLNLVAHMGINLWGIERGEVDLTAYVAAGEYKKLRGPARRTHTRLRVLEREGVPFVIHRYRKRWGIPVGILLCLAIIWYLSGFIWTIEIAGNEQVENAVILESLQKYGLGVGSRKQEFDLDELEQRILLERQDLSWVTLSLRGTTLYVEVRELEERPEVVDTSQPANVVAAESGQIVKLEVYDGQAVVEEGDAVAKGDLLVSGVLEDKNGNAILRHAQASVLARVSYAEQIEIPYEQTIKTPTGVVKDRNYLRIFSLNLPLFLATELKGDYELEGGAEQLSIFGFELPLWSIRQRYVEVDVDTIQLTADEARSQAMEALQNILQTKYADYQVVDTECRETDLGDRLRLEVDVICETDIGVTRDIYQ